MRHSVLGTDLALAIVVGGAVLVDRLAATSCWCRAPVAMLAGSAGIWLFYVQHQFEDAYWRTPADWDYADAALRGSSYLKLPKVLQFFTGNIGLHHVHHLNARIPNYNLQRAHDENPIFHAVPTLSLWDGLRATGSSSGTSAAGASCRGRGRGRGVWSWQARRVLIRILGWTCRACLRAGRTFPGYENIHVGVPRRNRPGELLGLIGGDAESARGTSNARRSTLRPASTSRGRTSRVDRTLASSICRGGRSTLTARSRCSGGRSGGSMASPPT